MTISRPASVPEMTGSAEEPARLAEPTRRTIPLLSSGSAKLSAITGKGKRRRFFEMMTSMRVVEVEGVLIGAFSWRRAALKAAALFSGMVARIETSPLSSAPGMPAPRQRRRPRGYRRAGRCHPRRRG